MRRIGLDMDALRSFVLGVENGSFARSAELLGRSTSAVSAQLKKLEDQIGAELVRKSGRRLVPTESGETLLSYARRLLDLNDEAVSAVRGSNLDGWIRLGLQEDFGETVLPRVLARFSRAHPKVKIEAQVTRSAELRERISSGKLDLAVYWDDGSKEGEQLASVPLRWLTSSAHKNALSEPLPLVALEAPCILRDIACARLDAARIPWRIAFVSSNLGALWAATAAGLGIGLRTPIGLPLSVRVMDETEMGLPSLPSLDLMLHRSSRDIGEAGMNLARTLTQAIHEVSI